MRRAFFRTEHAAGIAGLIMLTASCQTMTGAGDVPGVEEDVGSDETGSDDRDPVDTAPDPAPGGHVVRVAAVGVLAPIELRLEHPGGDELLRITGDGTVAFDTAIETGASYSISLMMPKRQGSSPADAYGVAPGSPDNAADGLSPCLLENADGIVAGADAQVVLACEGAPVLTEFRLSGATAPTRAVSLTRTAYAADVSLLQESVSITPFAWSPDAVITILGQRVDSGTPSAPLPLALGSNLFEVVVTHPSGLQRVYELTVRRARDVAEFARNRASNAGAGDWFGYSVATAGDTLAVGAPGEASAARGVDGDQEDDSAYGSGAVYVFRRIDDKWTQEAYIKASNAEVDDWFGSGVALSGDTLVVGAPGEDSAARGVGGSQDDNSAQDRGAVYVFRRTGDTWAQEAYLKASTTGSEGWFGYSVTLAGDVLAVGAPYEDGAGASDSGAVYVFRRADGAWAEEAHVEASVPGVEDGFGAGVALSGNTLAVGAPYEDSAATGVNANPDDDSASDSGAVYVFRNAGGVWLEEAYIKASKAGPNDGFGASVALSGDTLAAGALYEDSAATGVDGDQTDDSAPDSGAVYVFQRTGRDWVQEAYLKASNAGAYDQLGFSVTLSGDTLAAAAPYEASDGSGGNPLDDSAGQSGAVYVFRRTGGIWAQSAYLKASNAGAGDSFGFSVALSNDTLAAGAPGEASTSATDGLAEEDTADDSGAIYIFD